jgi:hypothetical protein
MLFDFSTKVGCMAAQHTDGSGTVGKQHPLAHCFTRLPMPSETTGLGRSGSFWEFVMTPSTQNDDDGGVTGVTGDEEASGEMIQYPIPSRLTPGWGGAVIVL